MPRASGSPAAACPEPSDGTGPRLVLVWGQDHAEVLRRVLEVRRAGDVPLVGDERLPRERLREWDRALDAVALPRETAWAAMTSGSTGTPKVVLRSEPSWNVSFPHLDRLLGVGSEDRMLLPVHPVSSMTTFSLAHARHSGFGWHVPERARLRPADLENVTLAHTTPFHLAEMVDLLEQAHTVQRSARFPLRAVLVGGDRLAPGLRQRAEALGLRVLAYYGAAELSLVALDDGAGLRAFPGVELRVAPEDGGTTEPCAEEGMLWVRTEQQALRVLDPTDGEATTSPPGLVRQGDWCTVGDRARLHADGRLELLGRRDAAILTGGATVVPGVVERALESLPEVAGALVLGTPHPRLGHLVTAYLQVRSGTPDLPALRRGLEGLLSPSHRPRRWILVEELPRTASGKVRRLDHAQAEALPRRSTS